MPKTKLFLLLLCAFSSMLLHAQKKPASVLGKVLDENENPLGKVNITVLGVNGNQVRVGVNAPKDTPVHREEIYNKIQREKNIEPAE